MRVVPKWVWISVVACVLAASWSIAMRHRAETENRAVGLMMDMKDVSAISAAAGLPLKETLKYLKEHGLVGVAVTEETLEELSKDGRIYFQNGAMYYGPEEERVHSFSSRYTKEDGPYSFQFGLKNSKPRDVLRLPVGIDPGLASAAIESDVEVIARHGNFPGFQQSSVDYTLQNSKDLGASAYLINGDQAIGNRALLEEAERLLRETGMHYLSPEFVQLGGDATLRKNLKDQTIRLHSISQLEIEKMGESEIIDRVVKAFRERDCRWILIRPPSQASENALKSAGELLFKLRKAIQETGGEVKSPRPFKDPGVPGWYAGLIALLALPAMLWTALEVFGRDQRGRTLAAFVVVASLVSFHPSFRGLGALTAAMVFPVLGFMVAFQGKEMHPISRYATISAISMVGGICVAGMLVGVEYMLRIEAFQGVKLAIFLTIALVGLLLLRQSGGWRRHLQNPVNWLAAGVGLLALVALLLLATRSGNDNPSSVSSLELGMRAFLDKILYVRPRTKEVFFGHPIMVVGAMMWVYRKDLKVWAGLLILAGMIGQTSMVNTMCHLHTPVALSLTRNLVGLVLGGIIGLVLWAFLKRWLPPVQEPSHGNG